jgi:DNA-binding MarR family transcriptional regulator
MQSIAKRTGSTDEALLADLATVFKYLLHGHGQGFFDAVGELDLSFTQVRSLSNLSSAGEPLSLRELAGRLGLSLPTVSRAVEGLVQRGYVTRTEDAGDRRMKQVALTGDGRALFDRLVELRLAGLADFVDSLGAADRRRLAAALAPIAARDDIARRTP